MLQLIPLEGGRPATPLRLAAGQRLGRHPRCELAVDDPSISRLHARVVERDGGLVLVDADSRNGLWYAGQRVTEVDLVPGCEFAVGRVEFKVDRDRAATPPPPVAEDVLDEELEFDSELEDAVAEVSGGARSAPPGRSGSERPAPDRPEAPAAGPGLGLELEDAAEIELGVRRGPARPGAVDRAAPASAGAGPSSAAPAADAGAAARAASEARRAALLAEVSEERGGLLRGDLTQYPAWVQGLVWILVLALFAAAAWFGLGLVRG